MHATAVTRFKAVFHFTRTYRGNFCFLHDHSAGTNVFTFDTKENATVRYDTLVRLMITMSSIECSKLVRFLSSFYRIFNNPRPEQSLD